MLLGMLLALIASALFNVAVAVQALDARTLPREHGLKLSLLGRLIRRRRWRCCRTHSGTAPGRSAWPR